MTAQENTPKPIVYIMRGIPGAGKSTWVKDNAHDKDMVISADFIRHDTLVGGLPLALVPLIERRKYVFDPEKTGDAMRACRKSFDVAIATRRNAIFIDNTNVEHVDFAYYVDLALDNDYNVICVYFEPTREVALSGRNKHGVPTDVVASFGEALRHAKSLPRQWEDRGVVQMVVESVLQSKKRVDENGNTIWELPSGVYHRLDGPAVIRADGSKFWYVNGHIQRSNGPAVEWADGTKEWWADGVCCQLERLF